MSCAVAAEDDVAQELDCDCVVVVVAEVLLGCWFLGLDRQRLRRKRCLGRLVDKGQTISRDREARRRWDRSGQTIQSAPPSSAAKGR
jgi:hypothetical protein